jgi:hypothetical protein
VVEEVFLEGGVILEEAGIKEKDQGEDCLRGLSTPSLSAAVIEDFIEVVEGSCSSPTASLSESH